MRELTLEELKNVNGGSRVTGDGYYVFVGTWKESSGSSDMHGPYGSMAEAEEVGYNACVDYYAKHRMTTCRYSVSYYCNGEWTDYPEHYVEKPANI